MRPEIARQVARDPAPHSRAVLTLALDLLLREVEATESRLAEAERRVTLGGIPQPSSTNWANRRVDTPAVHPDYVDLAEKTP